jgi:hypothetical protein
MKKLSIAVALAFLASSVLVFGQAEQIKKRAKETKKNVEAGQTNAPAKKGEAPKK